jgi:flagellar M-ring protein FliF
MATDPNRIVQQIRQAWSGANARTRTTVLGGALGASLLFGAIWLAPSSHDAVLFSGLDPKDSAAVIAALEGGKIGYSLGGGGTIVQVGRGDVDRARLLLAEQDLPHGGSVGLEMFQQQTFGLTDFAQQVNYRRALQGELERTIGALEPVAGARVHLTLPEKAVFADEKLAPTASVTLELHAGRQLVDRQVGAIRHLVAAAVEGLTPEEVTVVDTKGNLLSRGSMDAASAASLDFKRDLERDLERRITRLLERTVGTGGVHATVAADIDFSKIDTTEEVFDPEQTAVRSEATQEIHEGPSSARPMGLSGAPANEPGAPGSTAVAGTTAGSKIVVNKNYEVNRTVVHTVSPTANLRRVTVAVLVDGQYTVPEGGGEPVYTPRTEAELAELQTAVENAVGFNASRGDRIKVTSLQFRDRPPAEIETPSGLAAVPPWVPSTTLGIVALLALAFVLRGRRKAVAPTEILQGPATVEQMQRALEAREATGDSALSAAGTAPAALPAGGPSAQERILGAAKADPERAADIIREWIKEAA